MVAGIGLPIVDFQLASANQPQLLAQFQRTPAFTQAVSFYQANIGRVRTPDDLLKNQRLLTVALSAFQLEDAVGETGILRKLLTQDPTQPTSLAQQLLDPRFRAFAQAFASLRSDNGATISNPASVNAVLAGYQNNEYQKWVSNKDNDPTVRQGLFFEQQVNDIVDVSNTAKLFSQFQQEPDQQAAVAAYKSGIANVTSVAGLLGNQQVLDVALRAFDIDPSTVSTATLQRILTEPASASFLTPNQPTLATDPLTSTDPRFAAFAQAFDSLNVDGGRTVQSSTSINAIVSAYQQNQFAGVLAANDPSTVTLDFGSNAQNTINQLLSDFQNQTGTIQAISYYQSNIGNVRSADDLVNDPKLLTIALGAFNIPTSTVAPDLARQLLTNDPAGSATLKQQATALLQTDPDVARFVQAFSALNGTGTTDFADVNSLFQQFQNASSVTTAVAGFRSGVAQLHSVSDLTGNPSLLNFALTALGIDPTSVTASTVNRILTESPTAQASDPLLQSDPRFVQFVQAFGSLNTDGGVELKAQSSVDSLVNGYETNSFAQTVAKADPATTAADFADGSVTVDRLNNSFVQGSGVAEDVSFYQSNIIGVTSVNDLINNPRLLKVALGAFGIDSTTVSPIILSQVLTETPADQAADPTLTGNPRLAQFVQAFSTINTDNGRHVNTAASIASITGAYQNQQIVQSITAKLQTVQANPALAVRPGLVGGSDSIAAITSAFQANQFHQSIVSKVQRVTTSPSSGTISVLQILSNPTLQAVTYGALGLPPSTGGLPVAQQQDALQRAGFDPTKLLDPTFLKQFINQFLANAGQQQQIQGNSLADVALAALNATSGTSDGIVPIDLSFLESSTSGGSSAQGPGSLVSLFA